MFALRIKETKRLVRFSVDCEGDHKLVSDSIAFWIVNTREYAAKIATKSYAAWGEYHTPYICKELADKELEVVELKIVEA